MSPLRKALDAWLGRGEASITTPPMDGAFHPNDRLDTARVALQTEAPDDIALTAAGLLVSSGPRLRRVADGATVATFDADISALAGLPDGGAAAALVDGRILFVGGTRDGRALAAHPEIGCITALAAAEGDGLILANGSARHRPSDWKRDLMERNASGSLWRVELGDGRRTALASGLAYPYGLVSDGDAIVVAESWRSALTRISARPGGARTTALADLPAYPSRLARAPDGSLALALFAPRSQLTEFVLSEPRYRRRMMAEVDVDQWVGPCLRAGRGPLEPTQQGGVKQLGVLKPWAPSRSYGLVARLDAGFRALESLHSRANGRRHGVTACLVAGGELYFACRGDGVVGACALPGATS